MDHQKHTKHDVENLGWRPYHKLRDKVFEALNSKTLTRLQADITDYVPYTRRHTWIDGPALYYACNDWKSWSNVVLYLHCSQQTLKFFVQVYLCDAKANWLLKESRAPHPVSAKRF